MINKSYVIAVLGPESSGKSTLSAQIAQILSCPFVSEYAREYLIQKKETYEFDDLERIAKGQVKLWFGAMLKQPKFLVLDTELTVIKTWSELKFGKVSPWIEERYQEQNIDLYLLCKNDLEWKHDELRENPDLEERNQIFKIYQSQLEKLQRNYEVIEGQNEDRLDLAIRMIKKHCPIDHLN